MEIVQQLYTTILVQPIYNLVLIVYSQIAQNNAGLTMALFGLLGAGVFIPTMVHSYHEQQRVTKLQAEITAIQVKGDGPEQTQQEILALLKSKGIRFQGESLYLFGQAVLLFLLYPVLAHHWTIDQELLYSFVQAPEQLNAQVGNVLITNSSPTLSLLPAILLFFELRLSYQGQTFLTGFLDRWYHVILPLCSYFLIFWLPSGLSIVLATSLIVSLYLKITLRFFTKRRLGSIKPAAS